MRPISLEELEAHAALRDRRDAKYVFPTSALDDLLAGLADTHRVLEIDGRRTFAYDSVYYDTCDLGTYRAHAQRRRVRFKCRSRLYVDAGRCLFEVKLKSARGETLKRRLEIDPALHGGRSPEAEAFLAGCVGRDLDGELVPAIQTEYRRMTLVRDGERITFDFDLRLTAADGTAARMAADWVLLECKSATGRSSAGPELRRLGAVPVKASKYVLGLAMTDPDVRANDYRLVMRRYFAPAWSRARA